MRKFNNPFGIESKKFNICSKTVGSLGLAFTVPSTYILFNESSIPFHSKSKGYKKRFSQRKRFESQGEEEFIGIPAFA